MSGIKVIDGPPVPEKSEEELYAEYVKSGAGYCPHCGHEVLFKGDPTTNSDCEITVDVHCDKCYRGWTEVYQLNEAY